MNKKLSNTFWGLLLIVGGIAALAQSRGFLDDLAPVVWAIAFGFIAIAAFAIYLFEGMHKWPILFPVGVFGALALMLPLEGYQVEHPAIGSLLFAGIGLPFVVAYLQDRKENWWALIPAGVMVFLIITVLVVDRISGEWIGFALFMTLAIIFLLVYINRKKSWAILVSYIMFVLSFLPAVATTRYPEVSGIVVFFGLSAPFFYLYFKQIDRYWAIIPAGIFFTLGVSTAIAVLAGNRTPEFGTTLGDLVLFAGFAVTFAILWLRNQKRWGMVLAIIFAVVGIATLFGDSANVVAPLALIVIGLYVFLNSFLRRGEIQETQQ